MDITLLTTTIHRPEVLRQYRALDRDVHFIVAGDLKSPHEEIQALCKELGNARYLTPDEQWKQHERLSDAIGWNCIQRRNLAIVEASKTGADVIISIDDDNAPREATYFEDIRTAFGSLHTGWVADGDWFNLGDLADQRYNYRGLPYGLEQADAKFAMNGKPHMIGVVNGLIYGDPDINATERIELGPEVKSYHGAARDGIALDPKRTWSPINSQNTAWRSELAPLMLLPPGLGRYDDIWGSYIAQHVLSATDYHVLFGKPEVHQERNDHDLFQDLADELHGMRTTEDFLERLQEIEVDPKASVLDNLGAVLSDLERDRVPVPHNDFPERPYGFSVGDEPTNPLHLPFDFFQAWLEAF